MFSNGWKWKYIIYLFAYVSELLSGTYSQSLLLSEPLAPDSQAAGFGLCGESAGERKPSIGGQMEGDKERTGSARLGWQRQDDTKVDQLIVTGELRVLWGLGAFRRELEVNVHLW